MADNYMKDETTEKSSKIEGYIKCVYNKNGICILSDCSCMKEADKKLLCSSYKEVDN